MATISGDVQYPQVMGQLPTPVFVAEKNIPGSRSARGASKTPSPKPHREALPEVSPPGLFDPKTLRGDPEKASQL